MSKICVIDSYYPNFLNTIPLQSREDYADKLERVLNYHFGTADFYSRNLRAIGWEAIDIIANYSPLQEQWKAENRWHDQTPSDIQIALRQIEVFKPDVVFLQDLSIFSLDQLKTLAQKYILAGQCSCPMPPSVYIMELQALFTSLPHYVERFKWLGVPHVKFLPLAFEARLLRQPRARDLDVSIVGGVGARSFWIKGTMTLDAVAARFGQRMHWYGYGGENLQRVSPLRDVYRGEAWGNAMYDVYSRSKIVINRHGEIAEGFANNLRLYESTGMGAMLITEAAPNLKDLFPEDSVVTYSSDGELIEKIDYYLAHDTERIAISARGQAHTLAHHTYKDRMPIVSELLTSLIHAPVHHTV